LTIIRVGNGWHEEEHDDAIATGAAAGVYTLAVNLDKPGRIKAASATITGVGVAWNNCVCRFAVSLPVPGAFVYGAYATQILLGVYQFGAGAQNIQVTWWVLVED
jgi:hypothetical protein